MAGIELLKSISIPRLLKRPGTYSDGGGLNLRVRESGAVSWVFRYSLHGKPHEMGLGPYQSVSLAKAREAARRMREQIADGIDPILERKAERDTRRAEAAEALTFKECARAYIASHQAGWRSPKHAAQWTSTLATYAHPIIGDLPVAMIDSRLVMRVLEQLIGRGKRRERFWIAKNETADRVRGRIEAVLDWASARDMRSGENPARWKGKLSHQLPARERVAPVKHHAALPHPRTPAFFKRLTAQPGLAAQALQLTILTAVRTNEALGARWTEVDLKNCVWVIPAHRTKRNREHRVPLSPPAVKLLKALADQRTEDGSLYVFPGAKAGRPLSNMSMLMLLRRMQPPGPTNRLTVHGFRSTFRDWAGESTLHPYEIAEAALAHAIDSKTAASYRRGDLFRRRAVLMEDWGRFCTSRLRVAKRKPSKALKAAVDMAVRKRMLAVAA